jgi:hypothetical protein
MKTNDYQDSADQQMAKDTVELANKISQNLGSVWKSFDKDEHVDRLPVNLADVHFICKRSELLISKLQQSSAWNNPPELRQIIQALQSELFTHLEYHYESLRSGLEAVTKQLLPEETEEELLESIERKVNDALGGLH